MAVKIRLKRMGAKKLLSIVLLLQTLVLLVMVVSSNLSVTTIPPFNRLA